MENKKKEPTLTEKKVFAMLTENTGRHFLDSGGMGGGGYGRNWERNQLINIGMFQDLPSQLTSFNVSRSYDYKEEKNGRNFGQGKLEIELTKPLFRLLVDWTEYDADMQRQFTRLDNQRPDDSWMSIMDEFATKYHDPDYSEFNEPRTTNSYNGDCSLSQTIQLTEFENFTAHYIALQIHGGCDVRGGYTSPKIFRITEDMFWMWNDGYIMCNNSNCGSNWFTDDGYNWYFDGGGQTIDKILAVDVDKINLDGSITNKIQVNNNSASCPECGQGLLVG